MLPILWKYYLQYLLHHMKELQFISLCLMEIHNAPLQDRYYDNNRDRKKFGARSVSTVYCQKVVSKAIDISGISRSLVQFIDPI